MTTKNTLRIKKPPATEVLSIRLPKEAADWLRAEAARERRQIGSQFAILVEQAMERQKA